MGGKNYGLTVTLSSKPWCNTSAFKDKIKVFCHEATLYPSQNAHILSAGPNHGKMDNPQIKIRFYDYEHQATLADLHIWHQTKQQESLNPMLPLY